MDGDWIDRCRNANGVLAAPLRRQTEDMTAGRTAPRGFVSRGFVSRGFVSRGFASCSIASCSIA